MKIFLVDMDPQAIAHYLRVRPDAEVNVLLSYARLGSKCQSTFDALHGSSGSVVLDSGTYTLCHGARQRPDITFEAYVSYLEQFEKKFAFYFTFDADYSAESFENNHAYLVDMEKRGLNPVPVIHNCKNKKEIDYYLNSKHEIVAIGSGDLQNASIEFLYANSVLFRKKNKKLHYLGCTLFNKILNSHVYSCDSSTAMRVAPAGKVFFWDETKSGQDKTVLLDMTESGKDRKATMFSDYDNRKSLIIYVESSLGLCADVLRDTGREGSVARAIVVLDYYCNLQQIIDNLRGKKT